MPTKDKLRVFGCVVRPDFVSQTVTFLETIDTECPIATFSKKDVKEMRSGKWKTVEMEDGTWHIISLKMSTVIHGFTDLCENGDLSVTGNYQALESVKLNIKQEA